MRGPAAARSAARGARGGRARALGDAVWTQTRHLVPWWPRGRAGTLSPARVASSRRPIRRAVERLLAAGQTGGVPNTAGACRELLQRRQARWTVVRYAEVEPTTKAAEGALRPGVRWRQGSFGTPRAEGSRVVDASMTVVATLNQPPHHGLDERTAACAAALGGPRAPSLRPPPTGSQPSVPPAA